MDWSILAQLFRISSSFVKSKHGKINRQEISKFKQDVALFFRKQLVQVNPVKDES